MSNICVRRGWELWSKLMLVFSKCHPKFISMWQTIYLSIRIENPNRTSLFIQKSGKNWRRYSTITRNIWILPWRDKMSQSCSKPLTRTRQNPHPWLRVRVSTGTGAGCPGKPQGSPCHSLDLPSYQIYTEDLDPIPLSQDDIAAIGKRRVQGGSPNVEDERAKKHNRKSWCRWSLFL